LHCGHKQQHQCDEYDQDSDRMATGSKGYELTILGSKFPGSVAQDNEYHDENDVFHSFDSFVMAMCRLSAPTAASASVPMIVFMA
jgi:hypothetical protein